MLCVWYCWCMICSSIFWLCLCWMYCCWYWWWLILSVCWCSVVYVVFWFFIWYSVGSRIDVIGVCRLIFGGWVCLLLLCMRLFLMWLCLLLGIMCWLSIVIVFFSVVICRC